MLLRSIRTVQYRSTMPSNTAAVQQQQQQLSSKDRIASYAARSAGMTRQEREELVPALALRCYHLPGYSYWGDLVQYMNNNHPLFGLCCHHRLHPVKVKMRLVNLLGSIAFGLAVTNIIWLWLIFHEIDEDDPFLVVTLNGMDVTENQPNGTAIEEFDESAKQISISQGMVFLWTVGGGLHAFFDNTIWYCTACVCCLPGQSLHHWQKYQKYSHYFIALTVVLITAVATGAVLMRAAVDANSEETEEVDDVGDVDLREVELRSGIKAYDFLVTYAVELVLALVLYYPAVGFLLFSGVLGCGTIPILGGRPYEVKQEERRNRRSNSSLESNNWSSHTSSVSGNAV